MNVLYTNKLYLWCGPGQQFIGKFQPGFGFNENELVFQTKAGVYYTVCAHWASSLVCIDDLNELEMAVLRI